MAKQEANTPTEPCGGCGYDVSTLPDAERCPECGYDLVHARASYLIHADPRWIRSMRSGLATMRVGLWLQFASVLLWIPGLLLLMISGFIGLAFLTSFGMLSSILIDVGAVVLAAREAEPTGSDHDVDPKSRRWLKRVALCSAVLAAVQLLLTWGTPIEPALLLGVGVLIFIRGMLVAARVGLMSSYGICIARRAPNHAMVVKFRTGRTLGTTLIAVLSLVTGLGPVLAWFWMLRLRGQIAWLLDSAWRRRTAMLHDQDS
ncbi:MAG: hypothetical protein AAGG07_06830 [Planctomycetota bacterium]